MRESCRFRLMFNSIRMKNNEIQVLNTSELLGRQFTVYGTSEQPLFLAQDVAEMVEIKNISDLMKRVDDDEKTLVNTIGLNDGITGNPNKWFLTEDGLYEVLMQSRKPVAKQFKKGVKQILKEIRTKGGYITAQQNESPEVIMAKALKLADDAIKRNEQQLQMLQSENEELHKENVKIAPMAEYTKEVLQSNTTYTLTQVSKDLEFRSVYAFLDWAKDREILYRQSGQWMPNSKYSDKGYFKTRTAKFVKSDNTVGTSMSTVVTEAGRMWLHGLMEKEQQRKGGAL